MTGLKSYEIKHLLNLIEIDEKLSIHCKCDKQYWKISENIKDKLNDELLKL